MAFRVSLSFLLALSLLVMQGFGQQPIRVQVNEVIVPVTVTDEKGRFVSNLDQADFKIFDQGKEQKIEYFTRERNQPVVVGFLIDLSNNSRTQWKSWQNAAEEMVVQMLPDDKPDVKSRFSGYLIGYSDRGRADGGHHVRFRIRSSKKSAS